MIFSIDEPNIYEEFAITNQKLISLRKNPHYKILLYGRNLNLLCFIQGLLRRNIPPNKIKLVIPNIKFDMTTSQKQADYKIYVNAFDILFLFLSKSSNNDNIN